MGMNQRELEALYRDRANQVKEALAGSPLVLHKQLMHRMPLARKLHCHCKVCGKDKRVEVRNILVNGQRECNNCHGLKAYRKTYYKNRSARVSEPGYRDYMSVRRSIGLIAGEINTVRYRAGHWHGRPCDPEERDAFLFESKEFATLWVIQELGIRPSKEHRLRRIDDTKPFMPGNVEWRKG